MKTGSIRRVAVECSGAVGVRTVMVSDLQQVVYGLLLLNLELEYLH
jgi:hypothetical protein